MIEFIVSAALAQSCSCSVGGGGGAVPSALVVMPGMVVTSLDTSIGVVGGEGWRGFVWTDRLGNSMPDMAMPGHATQTATATLLYGLPKGFSLSAGLPLIHSVPLYPSDMRGDVERTFLGDTSVTGRWVQVRDDLGTAVAVGATLPSGKVVEGGSIRGGRGVVGVTLGVHATYDLSPYATVGLATSFVSDLYTPKDGYRVADTAGATLGARFTPRERGKLGLLSYGLLRWEGHDRSGTYVLDQTGYVAIDALTGFQWRFWAHRMQSMTWTARVQVPLWQVVGDPWIAQNYSVTTGVAFGFGRSPAI